MAETGAEATAKVHMEALVVIFAFWSVGVAVATGSCIAEMARKRRDSVETGVEKYAFSPSWCSDREGLQRNSGYSE